MKNPGNHPCNAWYSTGGSQVREFRLRGHDCVFGKYPAPVIPIGLADGHQVAVYPGGAEGPCLVRVEPSAGFVMYGPELLNQLAGFDPLRHRLFAYSSNRIRCYVADEEQEFFRDFLNNTDESQNTHPSIRRML